jgi:hypothetical protein
MVVSSLSSFACFASSSSMVVVIDFGLSMGVSQCPTPKDIRKHTDRSAQTKHHGREIILSYTIMPLYYTRMRIRIWLWVFGFSMLLEYVGGNIIQYAVVLENGII